MKIRMNFQWKKNLFIYRLIYKINESVQVMDNYKESILVKCESMEGI